MIAQIDITMRLVTCGAVLLLLILLLTGRVRRPIKLALAGLLIGAVAYLLNSSSLVQPGTPVQPWVDLASVFTPFFTWLFASRLFEREPNRPLELGLVAVLTASWFSGHFVPGAGKFGFYTVHLVSLGLVLDLLRFAIAGRNDDLVEKRRMIRLWLPVLVGLQAGGILAFETIMGVADHHPVVDFVNAVLILALSLFAGLALLQTDPELLVQTEDTAPEPTPAHDLTASETVLQDKLDAAMADGYYRTPGLTIAGLADHLDTPEHRLRALINQRLGHRNFSAYLNRHRIAEAKSRLASRDEVNVPVLTIAMDLGYNSLATFNRAFRGETGRTPTDFRQATIAAAPTDQN